MVIRKLETNDESHQAVLTRVVAQASVQYYNGLPTLMGDLEFDRKYDALKKMEQESGFAYDVSPTVFVGSTAVTALKKVRHEVAALSLDKVKYVGREKLIGWLGDKEGVLSWKLDGLTIVATYMNGKLVQAVTRGDGYEGSDVTHNAIHFAGLPATIPYKEPLVIRGEALMEYQEFQRINEENDGIYENPRNLAAATVQMLDAKESSKRKIHFFAFKVVVPAAEKDSAMDTETGRFAFLEKQGFQVVQHCKVDAINILSKIEQWKERMVKNEYPTDGLVLSYNDQVYADSLGSTGSHPRGSIAMKWDDETKETFIKKIHFSVGKTGRITPVAIFDPPVRLGVGSNVSRASLHNISIMQNIADTENPENAVPIKIGSRVEVALAQMIIPTVVSASGGNKEVVIPDQCPVCGGQTRMVTNGNVKVLYCENRECPARIRGMLENAFCKSGLYVKGLGPSQLEDLQETQMITKYPVEVFSLEKRYGKKLPEQLAGLDGWGQKRWENLLVAIDQARNTTLVRFLYSLGVPLLGNDLSKKLSGFWNGDIRKFLEFYQNPLDNQIQNMEGVGCEKARNLVNWCKATREDQIADEMLKALVDFLQFEAPHQKENKELSGLTFVITGSVHTYKNRDEFKISVETRGGKVAGSVSKNTSYLVTNDTGSGSGKNKKAKELNVPVISEDEFIEKFGK